MDMRSIKSLSAVKERAPNGFVLKQHFYRWQIKSEFMVILRAEKMFLFLVCHLVCFPPPVFMSQIVNSVYTTSVYSMSELKFLAFFGLNREREHTIHVYLSCTYYSKGHTA